MTKVEHKLKNVMSTHPAGTLSYRMGDGTLIDLMNVECVQKRRKNGKDVEVLDGPPQIILTFERVPEHVPVPSADVWGGESPRPVPMKCEQVPGDGRGVT